MLTFGPLARAGALVAAGGLVIGLSAVPAGSQALPEDVLVLSGSAQCVSAETELGGFAWFVEFTAYNNTPEPVLQAAYDVTITDASVQIGEGAPQEAELSPNPIPIGESASTSGYLEPTFNGSVVLTVDWSSSTLEDSGTESFTVDVTGPCGEPEPTTTTTAPAPAVQAVAVTPSFTG